MTIIKKLLAAATAAVSVSAFGMASVIASAEETTTTTDVTTTTVEVDTTTSETTTTDTSDTSDTTTTTTAPVSYSAWLALNKGGNTQQDNAVTFSANGTYTAKYKFDATDASTSIAYLVLESDINSEAAAGVKFKVTGIKLGVDEANATDINYNNKTDDVFGADETSKLYRLNIRNTDEGAKDLEIVGELAPNENDILFVTFTVEGLADPTTTTTTTTTTTRTVSYVGYSNNGTNTNTVSKTADEGVIAGVVTAVAAAALAAGAMTIRKKRK